MRNAYSVISSGTEGSRVALAQKSLLGKARERPDLVRQVVERARREGVRTTRDAVKRQLAIESAAGYSSAGYVIEVGAGVAGLDVGDRVACCGGGHANHAEVVAMPRNLVAKVPNGVGLDVAAFSTIAAVSLHGIRLAEVEIGDHVAVIGCGLVGQIACRLLTAAGAIPYALDIDPRRVDAARAGGADEAFVVDDAAAEQVRQATRGVGVDAVIVTAAADSNSPLELAADIARDRGRVVLVGAVPIAFPRAPLYDKELVFRVSRSYGPGRYDRQYEERGLDYPIGYVRWTEQRNLEAVLDLLAHKRLRLDDLIDEVIPVDEAERAYGRLASPADRPIGAMVFRYEPGEATPPTPPRAAESPALEVRRAGELHVGVIGPGSFAMRVLVPALSSAGAKLEVVGGGSGPSAEAAVRTAGFARVADSADAVIADDSVDAVLIATRHGAHARQAAQALAAGKSVFVEKPLALTVEELEDVMAAAATSSGILTVGFNRRFAPLLVEMRTFMRRAIGPFTTHYRINAGHIDPDSWVHDLEEGGGRILGEVCHFIDALRFLIGWPISSVHALGHGGSEAPMQARDNVVVSLRFRDGSVGTILYAADGGPGLAKERLEAFRGSQTAILDDFRQLDLFGEAHERKRSKPANKGHREEVTAFVTGVAARVPPIPLMELEEISRATFAVVESLRRGTCVEI